MTRPARWIVLLVTVVFVAFAGWRIFCMLRGQQLAHSDVQQSLQWNPGEPDALWARVQQRLDAGDDPGAASAARALLAQEPLQGRAFRVLADIATRAGHTEEASRLYGIAVHRAPRDAQGLNGLIQLEIQRGDYRSAMHWIDFYLRTSAGRAATSSRVLPGLVPLALDGRFASALVDVLREDPPWRADMMMALRANPTVASRVYGQLDQERALRPDEYYGWIDGLINAGQWDEAHTRWISSPRTMRADASRVFNGDFSSDPVNHGFDWRLPSDASMGVEFEPVAGTRRRTLHLHFFNQPVRAILLEHALRLDAGAYVLRMRIRTRGLASTEGMGLQVVCPSGGVIGEGDPLAGSADWQASEMIVRVPPTGCPGQWLRLNQIWSGAGAKIAGDLWLDDIRIEPMAAPAPTVVGQEEALPPPPPRP